MRIFGHPWIPSEVFKRVFSLKDIQGLKESEIALLEPLTESIKLAQHCENENIVFAVTLGSIRDALFANELGASYIVCQQEDAMEIQPIAQTYLFDAQVLVLVENEKEIDRIARFSIDGVIFPKAIV
jgi:hypothetical protein